MSAKFLSVLLLVCFEPPSCFLVWITDKNAKGSGTSRIMSFNHGSGIRWTNHRESPSMSKHNNSAPDSSHVDPLLCHGLDSFLCSHGFVTMFQSCHILASFFRSCMSEACGHVVTRR